MRYEPQQDLTVIVVGVHKLTPTYNYPHLPYAAPSIGAFIGNSPLRCGRDAARCQRDRESLLTTPGKCEKRRKQAASGGFLLDTFLCPRKEKYLVRGYENSHSNIRRVSDTPNLYIDFKYAFTHNLSKDWGFPVDKKPRWNHRGFLFLWETL